VDLKLMTAEPTPAEREAVDGVLGVPESGWEGGDRRATDGRVALGGAEIRAKRHRLLPALHAIQDAVGWISQGALNYICRRLLIPPAEAYGVATFYEMFSTTPRPPRVAHVCDDMSCAVAGAGKIKEELEEKLGPAGFGSGELTWVRSACLGLCDRAPAVLLQLAGADDRTIAGVNSKMVVSKLVGQTCVSDVEGEPDLQVFSSGPLLSRVGKVDSARLDAYQAAGGYRCLAKAFDVGRAAVIEEVVASNLSGRGGAAFPTGRKWQAVASAEGPRYVVANGDESEPGTFKDRVLMEEDPFAVVEAMTIAGWSVDAAQGFLYVRGEYPLAIQRLSGAVEQARTAGLLGNDILGRGAAFDIEIRRGAGAYICGEETALFNSIEGYRGEPRSKPPYPTEQGLFGQPTVVNNIETLVNVLPILERSGEAFAAIGTPDSAGTKLFCLSGSIARPGLYEVPFGVTLGELLSMAGGVRAGRELQAILIGGAAGTFVDPRNLDVMLSSAGMASIGASLGSGAVVAFDDTVDMQGIVSRIAEFFQDESCGQCVPCRVGTVRQVEVLSRLIEGPWNGEVELLNELAQVMRDGSICGLGHTASSAVQSAVDLGLVGGPS
jgi:NADH-quinone oxidoreductase subunit F